MPLKPITFEQHKYKVPLKPFSGSDISDTFFFLPPIPLWVFSDTYFVFSDTFCVSLNGLFFVVDVKRTSRDDVVLHEMLNERVEMLWFPPKFFLPNNLSSQYKHTHTHTHTHLTIYLSLSSSFLFLATPAVFGRRNLFLATTFYHLNL